jgi:hypothetical protein
MLGVVFAKSLASSVAPWLAPVASLAWPWYVPLGTLLTLAVGTVSSLIRKEEVAS